MEIYTLNASMKVYGKVESVNTSSDKVSTVKILSQDDERVTVNTYLPLFVGDIVSGVVEDNKFQSLPCAVIPYSKKAITAFFKAISNHNYYTRFETKTRTLLTQIPKYETKTQSELLILENRDSINAAVFETISMYAFLVSGSRSYGILSPLAKELRLPRDKLQEALQKWWTDISIRSLLLMGLTSKEITKCLQSGWCRDSFLSPSNNTPSGLKNYLMKGNLFTLTSLPYKKLVALSRNFYNSCPDIILQAGHILNKIESSHQGICKLDEYKELCESPELVKYLVTKMGCALEGNTLKLRWRKDIDHVMEKNWISTKTNSYTTSMQAVSRLTPEQLNAVTNALNYTSSIVIGEQGTGKTFLVNQLIHELERRDLSYVVVRNGERDIRNKDIPDYVIFDDLKSVKSLARITYRYKKARKVFVGEKWNWKINTPTVFLTQYLRGTKAMKEKVIKLKAATEEDWIKIIPANTGNLDELNTIMATLSANHIILAPKDEVNYMNITFQRLLTNMEKAKMDVRGRFWTSDSRIVDDRRLGTVVEIREDNTMIVQFDDGEKRSYSMNNPFQMKSIYLAWAISVEHARGMEWDVVLLYCTSSPSKSIVMNAITRAKNKFYLVTNLN